MLGPRICAASLIAAALLPIAIARASDKPHPATIIELPVSAGNDATRADFIAQDGRIAGGLYPQGSPFPQAVIWPSTVSQPTPLHHLAGDVYSIAAGLNASGVAVGRSVSVKFHAAFWSPADSEATALLPLAAGAGGEATAINDLGWVVGRQADSMLPNSALLWKDRTQAPTQLPLLPTTTNSEAFAISAKGEIVGICFKAGQVAGALWRKSDQAVFELPGMGGPVTQPTGLNNKGIACGFALTAMSHQTGVVWRIKEREVRVLKPNITGTNYSPRAINDRGDVVGSEQPTNDEQHAVIWPKGKALIDLNSRLPANSGWLLFEAVSINNSRWIVGNGTLNGELRGFAMHL